MGALASAAALAGLAAVGTARAGATVASVSLSVVSGGTGSACTPSTPCGSVQTALSDAAGDVGDAVVISVGPGTFI